MTDHPLLRQALPYVADSASLFATIADRPWAVLLDSGLPESGQGRFDIIAAEPSTTLVTRGELTEITGSDGRRLSGEAPLALLRQQLGGISQGFDDLPFCGGAIGYFSYDLARRLERLPEHARDNARMPEMAVGIYDWALVIDHQRKQSWLVGAGRSPATAASWEALVARFSRSQTAPEGSFRVRGEVRSTLSREAYQEAFERVMGYIQAGDCYQVNLAQGFSVTIEGDPWALYQRLRRLNPAPFGAYLNTPGLQLLSSSPERFLKLRGRQVETKPIKGTAPRDRNPEQDEQNKRRLAASDKDRAENLMIVDLLRNDLGRSCRPGSIQVAKLFDIESFATVHHLVSTITGQLADGADALDLLQGCFPGGSITGAPKLRAMEIIEELEPERRGVYCGSVGYLGFDGSMDTNIAIRTLAHQSGEVRFSAGGGLVADSRLADEYQESFHKAEAMLALFARDVGSDDAEVNHINNQLKQEIISGS